MTRLIDETFPLFGPPSTGEPSGHGPVDPVSEAASESPSPPPALRSPAERLDDALHPRPPQPTKVESRTIVTVTTEATTP